MHRTGRRHLPARLRACRSTALLVVAGLLAVFLGPAAGAGGAAGVAEPESPAPQPPAGWTPPEVAVVGAGDAVPGTADWVPYVGSFPIGCTMGNPSIYGVCDHHHSYTGAIDYHMPIGTQVRAAGAGQVVFVNNTCQVGQTSCEGGGGRWVGVQHPDGKSSVYMHLQAASVSVGQQVARGTVIGTVGFTGNSLVEHLHYAEQKPLYTRSVVSKVFACHGSRFVTYPDALGYTDWADVPYGSVVRNDGYGCIGSLFLDVVDDHTFYDEIEWLSDTGVTSGYLDGTFQPNLPVNRQGISAWLHRLAGAPGGSFSNPGFPDVPPGHVFDTEIWWMVATSRASGYSDNTYRPLLCVSRQGMAAFLYREAGSPPVSVTSAPFPDVPIDHPFAREIEWMVDADITSGDGAGQFRPGECVTRQAAAAFLYRSR